MCEHEKFFRFFLNYFSGIADRGAESGGVCGRGECSALARGYPRGPIFAVLLLLEGILADIVSKPFI